MICSLTLNILTYCDAVIERGWGERHQLSGSRGLRILPLPTALKAARIPKEYIWIYAPRDDEELAVVEKLLIAAAFSDCRIVLSTLHSGKTADVQSLLGCDKSKSTTGDNKTR